MNKQTIIYRYDKATNTVAVADQDRLKRLIDESGLDGEMVIIRLRSSDVREYSTRFALYSTDKDRWTKPEKGVTK
ncbi:hypothetical protein KAR91_52780 [Candidatus Pacearchaeota archaeon]|nr:hypothetical protein [Candidatus Pacearchaeota archaeon]